MPVRATVVVAILAVTLVAQPAAAQEAPTVEVTPYVALGTGAISPVGVAVTVPLTSALSVETEVAYRRGEGDFSAFSTSASLLWLLPRLGATTPYLAAGIGLAQFGSASASSPGDHASPTQPVLFSPGDPRIATRQGLGLTWNAGGGLKTKMNNNLDLRTDARWFRFSGPGSDGFRVAQGVAFDVGKR